MRFPMSICPNLKRSIVAEALKPGNKVNEIAKQYGVARSSLFKWVKAYGADAFGVQKTRGRPKDWVFASKLKAVLETQSMNDQELGEYLRSNGLYYSHIVQWKQEVLDEVKRDGRKPSAEAILLKKIRELERKLKLKDKALKEATALLILKKKAESAWPEKEEEELKSKTDNTQYRSSKKPDKKEPE